MLHTKVTITDKFFLPVSKLVILFVIQLYLFINFRTFTKTVRANTKTVQIQTFYQKHSLSLFSELYGEHLNFVNR